jgi:hypothetical protein
MVARSVKISTYQSDHRVVVDGHESMRRVVEDRALRHDVVVVLGAEEAQQAAVQPAGSVSVAVLTDLGHPAS